MNLCSSAVNSQRLLGSQKADVKLNVKNLLFYLKAIILLCGTFLLIETFCLKYHKHQKKSVYFRLSFFKKIIIIYIVFSWIFTTKIIFWKTRPKQTPLKVKLTHSLSCDMTICRSLCPPVIDLIITPLLRRTLLALSIFIYSFFCYFIVVLLLIPKFCLFSTSVNSFPHSVKSEN